MKVLQAFLSINWTNRLTGVGVIRLDFCVNLQNCCFANRYN